jgi:protein-S-isoprenylcysteine O-methyltransferase Ste14
MIEGWTLGLVFWLMGLENIRKLRERLMQETPMTPLRRILRQWESPPTWLLLFIVIAWVQSQVLPIWDAKGLGDWLGAAFIAAGVVLMIASVAQFARAQTTVMPREVARVLITGGVYRLSRNPIYLADALILAGLCLRWDVGAVIWVAVFVAVIEKRFIAGEEASLRAKFGPEFDNWAEKVRRWI